MSRIIAYRGEELQFPLATRSSLSGRCRILRLTPPGLKIRSAGYSAVEPRKRPEFRKAWHKSRDCWQLPIRCAPPWRSPMRCRAPRTCDLHSTTSRVARLRRSSRVVRAQANIANTGAHRGCAVDWLRESMSCDWLMATGCGRRSSYSSADEATSTGWASLGTPDTSVEFTASTVALRVRARRRLDALPGRLQALSNQVEEGWQRVHSSLLHHPGDVAVAVEDRPGSGRGDQFGRGLEPAAA